MASSSTIPPSRPVSAGGGTNTGPHKWGSTEEHPRTGVTVTLPTIQVTEPRQQQQDIPPLELPILQLSDPGDKDEHLIHLDITGCSTESSVIPTPLLSTTKPSIPQTVPDVKLPPLVVPPEVPPANLSEAIKLVQRTNMILYLTLQNSPSELEYNPYSFNVVSKRPKTLQQYAILSSSGVTQVWPSEVTFTTIEEFQKEIAIYQKLLKIRFFRVFRLRKTWQVWRRSVRSRKVKEAQTRISAYLVIHQPPFHSTLVHISALCDKLSHMGLLQLEGEDPTMMEEWVTRQQTALAAIRSKLLAFRSLILQVVATMVHADEAPADTEGSEMLSGEKKSPRSNAGSSSITRRHTHTSILKMVRVVDLMIATSLRTILQNTLNNMLKILTTSTAPKTPVPESLHDEDSVKDEVQPMFLIVVGVENEVILCKPTQDGLVNGLRTVMRACELTIMCVLPLIPYFTPQDRLSVGPPEDNVVLRAMIEEDSQIRDTTNQILAVVEEYWKKVEETTSPLEMLLKEAQAKTHGGEEGSQGQELGALGTWLARIEGLVTSVGDVKEVVSLGLLQVNQMAAKKVVVTSLRQQQQRMHQEVSQGFDQRVKALQADVTDKWLGLEQAPVTAEQVVNLLNYVLEVRTQMDGVGDEEKIIQEAYEMIQGYHITLHPEVHNKYEVLQKEVKRLRRSVRRSLMERPALTKRLEQLLEKEIEELDAETGKLAEQVQALRFLRVTSDREEALKMLEAADSRASTIRTQATTITKHQDTFQMPVCAFKELGEVEEEISLKMLLWKSLSEWEALTEKWYQKEVRNLDVADVRRITFEYRAKVDYLLKATQHSDVLLHLKSLVNSLEEKLPVLEALTDTALRQRHWKEIDTALGEPLPPGLTLAHVDEMNLHTHAHTLQQVAHTAQLQREMENRLKQVVQDWEAATLPVVDYIRKDLHQLGDLQALQSLLLGTDITLYLLLHSQHALHIKTETVKWKNIHTIIKGTLKALMDFEEEWKAIDPVLSTVTAHEVFPLQAAIFAASTAFWTKVMARFKEEPLVLSQLRNGMLFEEVVQEKIQLNGLRVCLAPLLAMRRQTCPRLFLLPDGDLLELLSKGQEADVCHKYLPKLFTGIGRLVRGDEGHIVALVSSQNETLNLAKTVVAHHGVEDWIGRVESGMRATLKRLILRHVDDDELPLCQPNLPLQVLDICRRIQWSRQITDVFDKAEENSTKPELQSTLDRVEQELEALKKALNRKHSALDELRFAYLVMTLLSLRDSTNRLLQDKPNTKLCYAWLQHLRHVISGDGRRAGVQISIGVENLDYSYEYMGVSKATIQTPVTLRAHHALITAALRHKCGVAVGGVGNGKTETLRSVARLAGQHLASFNCSVYTPIQSISKVVSGGVQGGFWLLLEEADHLSRPILARLSQYIHNIYQAKMTAMKRCVIDGQEMKLSDPFCLFMTVTSNPGLGIKGSSHSSPLLNHAITSHMTSVTICPPRLETLIEAVLTGHGFNLNANFNRKIRQCILTAVQLLQVRPPPALPRIIQAMARVGNEIRQSVRMEERPEDGGESEAKRKLTLVNPKFRGAKLKSTPSVYPESYEPEDTTNDSHLEEEPKSKLTATTLWMQHPQFSPPLTDEDVIIQALYAVLTPLLSERESKWRQIFRKNFSIQEQEEDVKPNFEGSDIEDMVRKVLLEWGYGKDIGLEKLIATRENVLEKQDSCPSDIAMIPQEDQEDVPCITEEGMLTIQEGQREISLDSIHEEEMPQELSSHGESLLKAALHMYSLLTIHHSCCIVAPSGVGKSAVWKVLAESLNRLWNQEVSKTAGMESCNVSWRVLQCGSFTSSNLLGSWDHHGTKWRKGVLFKTMTEAQNAHGERWIVFMGPFPQSLFAALSDLCQPFPTFKDEALHQITLGQHVRLIFEFEDEEKLTPHVQVRWPILHLNMEETDTTWTTTVALQRLLNDLPLLQTKSTLDEMTSVLLNGIESLSLPNTSQRLAAECICRLTRIRVTPTTSPSEVLEVLQLVLDLFHTARHPHLHQEVREGTYTPARLDSRSPAPSDAFLDYAARVVATPELRAGLDLLPQLLDTSSPILLYSRPGQGLSTFLGMFEKNQAPATRVIRFKCTPLSTAEDLFSCMTEVLLPSPLPDQKPSAYVETPSDNIKTSMAGFQLKQEPQDPLQTLAPGEGGFSVLILEDVNLQMDSNGECGTIWEAFRLMVECKEVVCPMTGRRYHLQRVVPLLAMTCPISPEAIVPARILRHCIIMTLPHNSSATCEHIIKVCLQDVLSEMEDDRLIPDATRDAALALYEELQKSTPSVQTPGTQRSLATEGGMQEDSDNNTQQDNKSDGGGADGTGNEKGEEEEEEGDEQVKEEKEQGDQEEDRQSATAKDVSDDGNDQETPRSSKSTESSSNLSQGKEKKGVGRNSSDRSATKSPGKTRRRRPDRQIGALMPNLHHLLHLTEALRRSTNILNLTVGQAGSLVCFEATRAFAGLFSSEELTTRVLSITRKHFREVEEGLAWWPGITEKGQKMMMHAKDYNEFLKNVQYPEGMKSIMFTNSHFGCLLKLVLTLESMNGHAIILGPPGVGKMSLTKLAAYYTRARVYHLDDVQEEAGRMSLIRAAMEASGVTGRRTVILLRQHSLTPIILDILYSIAQHGWSDGLWSPLRVRGMLEAIRQKGKDPPQENRWMTYLEEDDLAALKHRFITGVKRNLHICLIVHSEEALDDWCTRYPPMKSRWLWIKMDTWGYETLRQVARRILLQADLPPHILHQLQAVIPRTHLMLIHQENMTVTVSDFVEACQVTVKLLARRRAQLRDSLGLFKGGMDKLQETSASAEELKGELGELEPELKSTQEEGQRLTHALVQKRNQVNAIREQMVVQEEKVKEKCDAVNTMNEEIMLEVGEAVPGLEAGEKGIKALDKKDLVEVRVLNKPPDLVLAVMEPICLLLNVKLDWSAMKTLLGDPTMTKRLIELEKDNIPEATLRKIKKYTENSKFQPDEVAKVSKPCKPLCAWLKALDHYAQVLRNLEPKKIKLGESERELNTFQLEQRQLQQQLGQCERELSELQARYEGCVCRRQQLEGGIKRATARLQRCTRLTTVLADEDSRWSAKIKTLMTEAEGVYGECTVGGVAVAYLGSLSANHREKLRQQVIHILQEGGVVTPTKHSLVDTLCTPEARETWEKAGIYRDPSCFLQAAMVFSAVRRTLVIDPDFMCVQWLMKLYEETGGMKVLHARDEGVVNKVVSAAQAQKPIAILQTPTDLTYNLRKILQIPHVIQGPEEDTIEVRIVLVTGDAAPKLPPELCVHVTRTSFALPPLVLEERLLNDVLKMERSDLFDQQTNLTAGISRDQKSLDAVDDTILKKLTQAATSLLDNEELLAAFYEAKSTSAEFRTRLAESQRTLLKIGNVRDKYRPVATRGRLLFSTSTSLRSLSPSYVFSFRHFIHLFTLCITSGGRGEALSFDQRISSLVESVTHLVVNHVSRALHPTHRLPFITSLCASIAANEGDLTRPAWEVILEPTRIDEGDTLQRKALESVLGYDEDLDHAIRRLLEGRRILLTIVEVELEVGLLGSKGPPEPPRGRISDFNALMLLRLTKPHMLIAAAREVVNCMLADPTLHKPDLALTKLLGSDERKYPIMVRTDYGRDVAGEILSAAHGRGVSGLTRVMMPTTASKVNPLEKIGVAHLEKILLNSIQQGGWLVVQGAESPAVLPTLLGAMTNLASPDVKVHDDFRLVVTVSVAVESPCELTLLARPVNLQPGQTFLATLSAIAALLNHHHYKHHYLGGAWRRSVWKVATVHTISIVVRYWQDNRFMPLPQPPTLTPRTQVASLKSQLSKEFTPTSSLESDAPQQHSRRLGTLDGYINLGEITVTLGHLYSLSLVSGLNDDSLQHFLGVTYGGEETWCDVISSMPEEVGVVSRDSAVSIVAAHIAACLPDIHSLSMEVEYANFQRDISTITRGMFEEPVKPLEE